MRFFTLIGITILSIAAQSGNDLSHFEKEIQHMDLELSSQELQKLLRQKKQFGILNFNSTAPEEAAIERAIALGERLLKWIDLINTKRSDDKKIRLTSAGTRRGIPISNPKRYSPRSVNSAYEETFTEMPQAMKDILYSSQELTDTNPITDEEFILYGRKVDSNYQTAARWSLLIPYKFAYIRNRARDVRGYYYLTTNNWNETTLEKWPVLDSETQALIRNGLYGLCINQGAGQCLEQANRVTTSEQAISMYKRYFPQAKRVYDAFFLLRSARSDVSWPKESAVATIPFVDPKTDDVRYFIQHNIEDEFKWTDGGLKIEFTSDSRKTRTSPYIVFIPGVTANVDRLGGNRIEMDANKSLQEYEEQWTIRHEFGHVLGFPDCYHEFFDVDQDEFVNYQLDITDLMCSRAGNFTERMHQDLKTNYN